MPFLLFCMPAYGRLRLAEICMRQLRRTCDALCAEGIEASAIVVADDANLDTARNLGFGTVRRDNTFVSKRFNDGIQLALDPRHNPFPADFAVPIGSDDWVDWRILTELPADDTILCFQKVSFVREDGREMTCRLLRNEGGCGIRIYPRRLLEETGFRPADEDRYRACDTSILLNLERIRPDLQVVYKDIDGRQIVDWKSPGSQLNPYESLRAHQALATFDPFDELAAFFPAEGLAEMERHYARSMVAA